jgi:hypothetical protein
MTTKRKPVAPKTTEKPSLKCEDVENALDILNDCFERAMCSYMLLGETGHAVFYEEGLYGTSIEIGVKPTEINEYTFSTLKQLIPSFGTAPEPSGFTIGTIPVTLYILRKDSDVFKYPDQKFYGHEVYYLPNPFVKYYKNREYFE